MADENISIEISDKVSPSIATKLERIANNARSADAAVLNLKAQLATLNGGALANIASTATNASRAINQSAIASQRLATEQQRTATAAQRLATQQQRTATATAQATAANNRAALAALRLQQAQDRAAQASQRSATSLMSFVRGAAALAGVGLSAGAILSAADAYTVLQNKLQNVAESEQQVAQLTNELFDIANKTRTPVQETAQAFTRFDMALKGLGKSQTESLRLTETVNKMLTVSGATTNEQASALLQLSQAFNKGKLDGDEFRTVMELMPTAADAIAKSMGVTRGELLKLAPQGKITAKIMADAFSDASKQIDEKFGKTVPTMGQAFTVLRNKATQAFGELNKQIGLTAALSKFILFIADNMKALAVGVAVVGAALLAYFGPALLAALAAATKGVIAFTLAIAANPIGLLLVGITAAIAAVTVFGDNIKVTADGAVTLKDMFRTAFAYIQDYAKAAASFVRDVWNTAIDWINEKTGGMAEGFRNVGELIMKVAKGHVNFIIALWVGGFNAIKALWNKFPQVMQFVFASVVNAGTTAVETLVNAWQIGLRKIAELGAEVAPDMAARLNAALDAATVKLPRMEVGESAKNAAGEVSKAFTDAFRKDYVGDAASAFMARARQIAAQRNGGAGSELRKGSGGVGGAEGETKEAVKRALALAKINAELDNELSRLFMLKPAREAQARFDQIEEQLLGKKIKLTQQESEAIKGKIKAIQDAATVQKEYDRIYEEATGPLRDYNASLSAADMLLKQGAITQAQYTQEINKSAEAYKQASDPMYQHNRDLQQEYDLLKLLPKQREIEQQVMQITNDLLQKGVVLTQQETAALRDKIAVIADLNAVMQQEAALMDSTVYKRQQFIDQMAAIKNLRANETSGFTAGDQASATDSMLQSMGIDTTNFKTALDAQASQYQTYVNQLKEMNAQKLISDQEYAAASMQIELARQNVYLNSAGNFFGQLAELQKSGNKKMQAVGKAAAIAQAMISTYQSATSAYAAMASIPYVGPALGAAAAAAAIAAGLANVAQIRAQSTGFKVGGYTGNIGVNEVAGVVHGKEYVMDANATARIGVANLQALQSGAATVQSAPKNGGGNVGSNAKAGDNSKMTSVNVPVKIVNVTDPSEALAALNTSEGEKIILNAIERNPNTVRRMVQS